MKGKGSITQAPQRSFRWILAIHMLWIVTVGTLGAWWAKLVLDQSARITELEAMIGITSEGVGRSLERTRRMLFWESGFFLLLMIAATVFLMWIYFRDEKRAKSLQAFSLP